VWSNCLAGWMLGGGGGYQKLPLLFAGGTFLYVGGMFLNDAFDVQFDRQFRTERPIPSGVISIGVVCAWGIGWLLAGMACLFSLGINSAYVGFALLVSIVIYDWIHKRIVLAPILMGMCRLLLYLVVASSGEQGITGFAVWGGVVMGAY